MNLNFCDLSLYHGQEFTCRRFSHILLATYFIKTIKFLLYNHAGSLFTLDHNDGQFFRAMEWLIFFFRPPLPSMVFQWF